MAKNLGNLIVYTIATKVASHFPFEQLWPVSIDLDGVRVLVRNTPLTLHTRQRLLQGKYETAERALIQQFIKSGDHVLEIGASVGILSSLIGRQIGETGRIVCVEANPRLRDSFWQQVTYNGLNPKLITGLCCPIWSDHVPVYLLNQNFHADSNTLVGKSSQGANDRCHYSEWLTASQICLQVGLNPTTIVVDIEGTEEVWSNHSPIFPSYVRTLIIEFHSSADTFVRIGEAIQALINEGFKIGGFYNTVFAMIR